MFTDAGGFVASSQINNGDAASRPSRCSSEWYYNAENRDGIGQIRACYGTYLDRPFYQMKRPVT